MGVSVEWFSDIAGTLGLTRPALYKYVTDREDLQFRCYQYACEELSRRFAMAQALEDEPVNVLLRFLETNISGLPELAVMSELFALRETQQQEILMLQSDLIGVIAGEIERGISARAIRPLDAELLAQTLLGLSSWPAMLSRWGAPGDKGLLALGTRELLLRGLAVDPEIKLAAAPTLRSARPRPDVFSRSAVNAAKRENVLIAASALFNRRGIGATRIEDVAAALSLSKRAVYHYVGQKQDLVDACVERSYEHSLSVMAAAGELQVSPLSAIAVCIREVIVASGDPDVCVMVPYVGYGQVSAKEQASVREHVEQMLVGYRRLLEAGVRNGSIRDVGIEAIQLSLPGIFCWSANVPAADVNDLERRSEALADIAVRGILA